MAVNLKILACLVLCAAMVYGRPSTSASRTREVLLRALARLRDEPYSNKQYYESESGDGEVERDIAGNDVDEYEREESGPEEDVYSENKQSILSNLQYMVGDNCAQIFEDSPEERSLEGEEGVGVPSFLQDLGGKISSAMTCLETDTSDEITGTAVDAGETEDMNEGLDNDDNEDVVVDDDDDDDEDYYDDDDDDDDNDNDDEEATTEAPQTTTTASEETVDNEEEEELTNLVAKELVRELLEEDGYNGKK